MKDYRLERIKDLKPGEQVYVHADPSVGINPWVGTIVKVYDQTILVRDEDGEEEELSFREFTPNKIIEEQERQMRLSHERCAKEEKELEVTVTEKSLTCKCKSNFQDDFSLGCTCTEEGLNPNGKVLAKKEIFYDLVALEEKGSKVDVDSQYEMEKCRRFKGPFG